MDVVWGFFGCCLQLLHAEQASSHYSRRICCSKSTQEMGENKRITNVRNRASTWTITNSDDKSIFVNRRSFGGQRNEPVEGETCDKLAFHVDTKHRVLRNVPRYPGNKETSRRDDAAALGKQQHGRVASRLASQIQTVVLNLWASKFNLRFRPNKHKPKSCSHAGHLQNNFCLAV